MPVAERFATEIIPEVQNEPKVKAVDSLPSRTKEVVKYLNSEDSSGTKRKEQITGGENGDEKRYRIEVAQQLRAARKSAREYATASKDNSIIDSEYPKQFKRKHELEKAQGDILDIERTLKQLNPGGPLNKLNEFKNKKQIAELNEQMRSIMDKYGNLTKIQSEISYSNSITSQMANEFTSNLETIEAERPNPKEILEKYYGEKLTEFQNHQKELLRIENRKPVPLEGIVEKYGIIVMHAVYPSGTRSSGENNAIKDIPLLDRVKITLLKPALSASSFRDQEKIKHGYGNFAMVYGKETEICAAFKIDGGTRPTVGENGKKNFQERKVVGSSSFNRDRSVNTEIINAIENRYLGGYNSDPTRPQYNELVVVGEPVGLNLFIDQIDDVYCGGKKYHELIDLLQETKKLGLPAFGSVNNKMYKINIIRNPSIVAEELNESRKKNNRWSGIATEGSGVLFKDCIIFGEEITPQDVMKMESPITWEKQIEIAKELSEKGIFDDTNLPISLRS
jgi:hypothetical protein